MLYNSNLNNSKLNKIKKFNLLFVLVLTLFVASCSSDDDDSSSDTSGDILGTWIGVTVDYSGTTVTTAQGQTINADYVGEAYDVDYSLEFTENPNNIVSDGFYSIELTTTIAGQNTTQNVEDLEFLSNGTWSRSGTELTVTANGETSTADILELTENTLKIGVTEVSDLSQQGFTVISTTNVIATYTR